MVGIAVLTIMLAACSDTQPPVTPPTPPSPPVSGAPSSFGLIDAALNAGTIDAETALTYKVFASFKDSRLPSAYQGDDSGLFETDALQTLSERFDTLSSAVQVTLAPFLMRPSDQGSWANPVAGGSAPRLTARSRPGCDGLSSDWAALPTYNFKANVWYRSTVSGELAKAQVVVEAIDKEIWPALIGRLGMQEPLSDTSSAPCNGGDGRLDVYIVPRASFKGLTTPEPAKDQDSYAYPTYIMLDSNLSYDTLKAVTAHEIMHAIQFSFDTASTHRSYNWLDEATATWAIDYVYLKQIQEEHSKADCFTNAPQLSLDDGSLGHCSRSSNVNRYYGAYLFFQFLANSAGAGVVKASIEATTTFVTGLEAVNASIPGGFEQQWPQFAVRLYNDDPINKQADSFKSWDDLPEVPRVSTIDGDLNGAPEKEDTLKDQVVANLSSRYYLFAFTDPNARALMFHNTFYKNHKNGEKVFVQALWKPANLPWVEEIGNADWTNKEWIGFCRDGKFERLEQLVVIVSSAKWQDPENPIKADNAPSLKRNNLGCWGYQGTSTRVTKDSRWSSGQISTEVTKLRYELYGEWTQDQYLRVQFTAPYFKSAGVAHTEAYGNYDGCSYSAQYGPATVTSPALGGNSLSQISINYFNEALPDFVRNPQESVIGSSPRAYMVHGETLQALTGTVSGKDCPPTYSTNVSIWLNTRSLLEVGVPEFALPDGRLQGTYTAESGFEKTTYSWNLSPAQEP